MNSLDFLYIALGSGFLILVVFLSVLILHLTLLLKDIAKITEDLRQVTDKVKNTVLEPFKMLSELTAKFGFIQQIIDRIRAKYSEESSDEEVDLESPKSDKHTSGKEKNGFSSRKLGK